MKNILLRQIIMLSKLTIYGVFLQCLFISMLMASNSEAQKIQTVREVYVNLEKKEIPIQEIFNRIESSTDFYFSYYPGDFDSNQMISITKKQQLVSDVLLQVSKETKLAFRQVNNSINVRKKESDLPIESIEVIIQEITITGRVTSSENNEGLPGANVIVKSTSLGTVTDVEGFYSLEVPGEESILVFSSVGYLQEELVVGNKSVIDLVMTPDITALEEIVVIGYGEVKKKDMTGAVVALDESEMTTGGNVSSVAQMMQGRAAGVEVSTESSEPGANLSVVVRGLTSISNSNQPLYVVDGFPMSAGVTLNPTDIERIDILKDASATAIYGSRGSAGVIMITTKKGNRGKVQVSYDGYAGVQQINNTVDFINWNQYYQSTNIRWEENRSYDGNPWYTTEDITAGTNAVGEGTDWLNEGTQSAAIQNHQISISGGNENTRYSLSGNFFQQDGILRKSSFDRGSIRFNFDTKISKKANIGAHIYTQQTKSKAQKLDPGARNESVMYKLLTANPGRPAFNADGSLGQIAFSRDNNPIVNPIGQMTVPDRDLTSNRTYVNLWADIEIVGGLVAKLNIGYDQSASTASQYVPGIYTGEYVPDSQKGQIMEDKLKNALVEGTLSYNKTFSEVHSLTLLGGASMQYFDKYSFGLAGVGFPTDKTSYYDLGSASQGSSIQSFRSNSKMASVFARANYSFNDKYLLTATIRGDGDSKFGANNKWGVFPSASAAWRISEEGFIENIGVIDNLKIRLGYGVTGNNSFGAYTALNRIGATGPYTFNGTSVYTGLGAADNFAANPDLQWETSTMLNLGLDFGLWESRLTGSIEVYNTDTEDLIIDKSISAASTGYTIIRANVGEINNKGIELTIGGDIIDNNFKWTLMANASRNTNKVIKLDEDNFIKIRVDKEPAGGASRDVYTEITPGQPIGNFIGYVYRGVLNSGEVYAPQPLTSKAGQALYEDIDNSGEIDQDDRVLLGNSTPDFIYGINNRFSYKGLSIDLFFQGVQGNDVLNLRRLMIDEKNTPASLERYNGANTNGSLPGDGYFYGGAYGSYVNNKFVEDGSYLRLKNVIITYKLNTKNINWLGNVEFYVSGQNLLTWTNYSGFDPEVSFYSGNGIGRGIDDNGYPNVKTYTGGLRITF